jgi:hypothetical protein
MVKQQPVHVVWIDSASHPGWVDLDKFKTQPITVETVGWLVEESKESMVVALSGCWDGTSAHQFLDLITIPAACIRSVHKIKSR